MNDLFSFGAWVRRRRKALDLTQAALADRVGCAVRRMQERSGVRPVSNNGIAGTPQQITERLLEGITQGAHRITVTFADSPRLEGTQLFIASVLPHLA